jgi:hypothetical protein
MTTFSITMLSVRARRRRIYILLGFAAVFLAAGLTARFLALGDTGHVEFDALFRVGGVALPSAILVLGWLLGRFPLIATLVLFAAIVSDDRVNGQTRLYSVRPTSLRTLYGSRASALALVVIALSATLMPLFDLLMLGEWAGIGTFVLIIAYVVSYGALTLLLSVWTRADAAIALLLAAISLVWDTLRRADLLTGSPPGVRELVTFLLPPQGALLELEGAFADIQPVPWGAFAYVLGYGVVMLILAMISLGQRER